ncbi:CRISPR-associated ring nuclease Crn3/Csx3 [Spirulina major]|uniref:CRISPR-associated ring nuclease Crn3/Csx3 n=1 Tax=Spirulina major TaxID=270636 RepID=UPI0009325792|nr:CRISPR-associated ring nuclease Crn3/Csx3 [Spirulina major]
MPNIHLSVISHTTQNGIAYQHLRFQIATDDHLIEPPDLKDLTLPPALDFSQGVVIEGKGPIWLYGHLVHECHPAAWVACYDPRLGAVVVSAHTRQVQVGQILALTLPVAPVP